MEKIFEISDERERLKEKGIKVSQAEIADALGVNQTTVMRWEKNPRLMKPFTVDAVRRFFADKDAGAMTTPQDNTARQVAS